ncbi:hypothetical protein B0H21DRAFT_821145 [Amylocystis lapponica]|nr:hypothetical protein B0H21DRAFT_821145 [Amylocystis lapponica]
MSDSGTFTNVTIVDDQDPAIEYVGSWHHFNESDAAYGTLSGALSLPANLSFFWNAAADGDTVTVLGTVGPANGTAVPVSSYQLDQASPVTYTPPADISFALDQQFYLSPPLPKGPHVLVIQVQQTTATYASILDYLCITSQVQDSSSSQSASAPESSAPPATPSVSTGGSQTDSAPSTMGDVSPSPIASTSSTVPTNSATPANSTTPTSSMTPTSSIIPTDLSANLTSSTAPTSSSASLIPPISVKPEMHVGAIVGGVVGFAAVALAIFLLLRHRRGCDRIFMSASKSDMTEVAKTLGVTPFSAMHVALPEASTTAMRSEPPSVAPLTDVPEHIPQDTGATAADSPSGSESASVDEPRPSTPDNGTLQRAKTSRQAPPPPVRHEDAGVRFGADEQPLSLLDPEDPEDIPPEYTEN